MPKKNKQNNQLDYISELRQDPVSGDWIVIAILRGKRPYDLIVKKEPREVPPKSTCPFENPQDSGHKPPELIEFSPDKKDWFLQIVENKYPAFEPENVSIQEIKVGPYQTVHGRGYHDLLILKDHFRSLSDYSTQEIALMLRALQKRYEEISQDKKIKYISIFHNWGSAAGASIYHPHWQIIAIPVIPPDIQHSLSGSLRYYHRHKKCVHCEMVKFELKEKKRIIFQNSGAVAFSPFVSREPFEIRIFPKKHFPYFEETTPKLNQDIAEALRISLKLLKTKLDDPDLNFFIHTAPTIDKKKHRHYHWHIEIFPKISVSAGFELGTGIEITTIDPEEGAKFLKQ